jgi:protein gp37
MGKNTDIEWCDSTVNPIMGCAGCELWMPHQPDGKRCYAGRLTEMRAGVNSGWPLKFTEPVAFDGRMKKAASWPDLTGSARPLKPWLDGFPRLVFLDDLGDTFSESITFELVAENIMPWINGSAHIWQFLTKRPRRMATFFRNRAPENVWVGTSVTANANLARIDDLRRVNAAVRFVSLEPLVEDVSSNLSLEGIHWVIVGGESGARARPMDEQWVRTVRALCIRNGIPFFFKQWGGRTPKAGGRLLDGVACNEMPGITQIRRPSGKNSNPR